MKHFKGYWIRRWESEGKISCRVYASAKYKGHTLRELVGADTARNRQLAKDRSRKWLADIAEEKLLPEREKSRITVSKFNEMFLDRHSRRKKSCENDKLYLDRFADFSRDKQLKHIDPEQIILFKCWLEKQVSQKGRPYHPIYINRHLQTLRTFFNKAKEWGYYFDDNPVKGKLIVNEEKYQRTRYLDQREFQNLLELCDQTSPILKPIVITATHTGLRLKEMKDMKKCDVNLDNCSIHIPDSKTGLPGWIPISDTVFAVIEPRMQILASPEDRVLDFTGFDRQWKKLKKTWKEKGFEDFQWRDSRHTFATHIAPYANDIMTLRGLMRHQNIKMTMRYAHLFPETMKRAVLGLDKSLPVNLVESGNGLISKSASATEVSKTT